MSVVKMNFISIVGMKEYFNDFIYSYMMDSGLQPENALGMLENVKGLTPFSHEDDYEELSKRINTLIKSMGIKPNQITKKNTIVKEALPTLDTVSTLEKMETTYNNLISKKDSLVNQLNECSHIKKHLQLLGSIDIELENLFNLEYIKFRFGKMPQKSYQQLQIYIEELEVIVIPVSSDDESVWIMYFTPQVFNEKVDGILSSLYFERTRISGDLKGTPSEALKYLQEKMVLLNGELDKTNILIDNFINEHKENALYLYDYSLKLLQILEIKRLAAHTEDSFYLIGWIPAKELSKLVLLLEGNEDVIYIIEDPDMVPTIKPPTELKNNILFKPFETLVRLYGLPVYNEIDPTSFVAITYFIMFGFMFGDVGQGVVFMLLGYALMRSGKLLGGVITGAGMSSTLFGFMYGSVFGIETWISPLWVSPLHNINTMLYTGVGTGLVFITISMILNIINGIKDKDLARILFDRNGLAGFIFYWTSILFVLYFVQTGRIFISYGFISMFLLVPIIVLFLKEPLDNLLHKKAFLPEDKSGFFVEKFFELFETLLSFVSNTISFIRLSAFALNHAGLFMAVLMLAGMTKGVGSIIEIILGNILIILLEGLIVGIQALRLEYYELFGRFFTGGGREYKPLSRL